MLQIPERQLALFEAALAQVESPFASGDIIALVGESLGDAGILAGLNALVAQGMLIKVDGTQFGFSSNLKSPGIVRSAVTYLRSMSQATG